MKAYNQNVRSATKKLSQDVLDKSEAKIYKLTHPSDEVSRVGFTIGKGVAIGLIAAGFIAIIGGRRWGVGSCLAGALTIASHAIKGSKKK